MIRIAFDLCGTTFVALDQQADGRAGQRHRGGEKQRLAGHELFGRAGVRHDSLFRFTGASAEPGQGQRSRHELQESTAADRVRPFRSVPRELAVQQLFKVWASSQLFKEWADAVSRRGYLKLMAASL